MAKHKAMLDIETYSAADLSDVGVYRYVDDPSFEVLLIAYSLDDSPVKVIDLKGNMGDDDKDVDRLKDDMVDDFLGLLTDPSVIKYAYNANFERVCLASGQVSRCLRSSGAARWCMA